MTIDKALHALEAFQGDSLTESLSDIENRIIGSGVKDAEGFYAAGGIDYAFMDSAITGVWVGYRKNKRPFSPKLNLLRNGLVVNLTCN